VTLLRHSLCARIPLAALAAAVLLLAPALVHAQGPRDPANTPPRADPEELRSGREILLQTEAHDARAGEEAAREVAAEFGLVEEADLVAYVSAVGQRLVRVAPERPFSYRFQIVDQDAPNAFALPGGYVFVSRGLLTLANTEQELANVLAHEIMHVALRHAAAQQQRALGIPGPFRIFSLATLLQYSRDQEREADRQGQDLAAKAGYDPRGMASFLEDLDHTERLELGVSRLPSFLDTHPATTERVATAASRAELSNFRAVPGIAASRADYLRRIEGLTLGLSAAEGVFHENLFLHADLDFALRFPAGWETENTRKAVGAISRRRDAMVFLEHGGSGSDPAAAAREYFEKEGAKFDLRVETSQPVDLGRAKAWRATGIAGGRNADGQAQHFVITFIAHQGSILRLIGVAPGGVRSRFEGTFLNVARSFRPLSDDERNSIRERALHVALARPGETLGDLSARTGNQWNLQQTAVMNDLFASDRLSAGQLVKVAVLRSYRIEPTTPSDAAPAPAAEAPPESAITAPKTAESRAAR
jgi:predicted Zn-dependent protease